MIVCCASTKIEHCIFVFCIFVFFVFFVFGVAQGQRGLEGAAAFMAELLKTLLQEPLASRSEVSLVDLMKETSISLSIIEQTLRTQDILRMVNGTHVMVVDRAKAEAKLAKLTKPGPRVTPTLIHWAPLRLTLKDKWTISSKSAAAKEASIALEAAHQ